MEHAVNRRRTETLNLANTKPSTDIADTVLAKDSTNSGRRSLSARKIRDDSRRALAEAVGPDRRHLQRRRQAGRQTTPPLRHEHGDRLADILPRLGFVSPPIPYRHLDGDPRHHGRPWTGLAAEVLGVLLHVGDRPESVDELSQQDQCGRREGRRRRRRRTDERRGGAVGWGERGEQRRGPRINVCL